MKSFRALFLFAACLAANPGICQEWTGRIEDALGHAKGASLDDQNPLAKVLSVLDTNERNEAISWLIQKLPSLNRDQQLSLGSALSTRETPWTSSHEKDLSDLYQAMLKQDDQLVRTSLDTALASAKGLYFDAINDYNSHIGTADPNVVNQKFVRMSEDFPKSQFAGNAAFYRAQYWTKLAQVSGQMNSSDYLKKSDDAFNSFIAKQKSEAPFTNKRFDADVYFFKALNKVLEGQEEEARSQLNKLAADAINMSSDVQIYVYRLFYVGNYRTCKAGLFDEYFKVQHLAAVTADFIRLHPNELATEQGPCKLAPKL